MHRINNNRLLLVGKEHKKWISLGYLTALTPLHYLLGMTVDQLQDFTPILNDSKLIIIDEISKQAL